MFQGILGGDFVVIKGVFVSVEGGKIKMVFLSCSCIYFFRISLFLFFFYMSSLGVEVLENGCLYR